MTTTPSSFDAAEWPVRPRLRPGIPVLRRPGSVQVGVDSSDAVVIAPAGIGLDQWLRLLDGSRSIAELFRHGQRLGLSTHDLSLVLDRLGAAGLISRSTPRSAPGERQLRVIGAGRLGRAVAHLLARADLGLLELVDDDLVDQTLYPDHSGLGSQASALHAELHATLRRPRGEGSGIARGPLISIGPPWSDIAGAREGMRPWALRPDLTVLTSDRLDVDRMVTDTLLRADQPHLLVRAAAEGVVVGPLVLPGRTACVRCTDLVRCELDPDWPAVLSQLCRTTAWPEEPRVGWAAGTAATHALRLLAAPGGPWPETAGATIELGRDYIQRRRSWPRHPACGCSWTIGAIPPLDAIA